MKFNEMKYERPDFAKTKKEFNELLDRMEKAETSEEFFACFKEVEDKSSTFQTMYTLAYIRYTINTQDEFYSKEQEEFDKFLPEFQEISTRLSEIRLNTKFRPEIVEKFGHHILDKDEVNRKLFNPEIIEDRIKENQLSMEYQKLMSSCLIDYKGEKRNMSQMGYFMESKDRDERKEASTKVHEWFMEHEAELDRIYDDLVKVRHNIGLKLGFENFIPVAYGQMGRTDWTKEDAKKYRKQILDSVVPLTQKLYKEQKERIGVEDFKFYDVPLMFLSGNPMPVGGEDVLVDAAKKMYGELSPETDEFFKVMTSQELMDLTTKEGKAPGGYMTTISDYKVPFIFSNFNKTSGDVDVLTHEAGHAFQGYMSRDIYPSEYQNGTMEVAETHSMSMEFFTHPWMELFFGEDTEKYYYAHVVSALQFLPYGASIDEFQEYVYENPEASPKERRMKYREIEKKYLPHLDYDGFDYYENGGRWQRQLHVYEMPFYYLDYTIAQVNAFQFFIRDLEDHEEAWSEYLKLCKLGGKYPFKELVKTVGINNPFEEGTIGPVVKELEKYLDSLDKNLIK